MPAPTLSLLGKRWHLRAEKNGETTIIEHLRSVRGIDDRVHTETARVIDHFPDARKAAERVHRAMQQGERIALVGDYDCDGITSVAQLVRFFERRAVHPLVLLPHRVHDGYGLKESHIDLCREKGTTLLITADTGIAAHQAAQRASEAGIDLLILDHHHCTTRPPAFAILHPALSTLPTPHPSAAGVVYFFLHALEGGPWRGQEEDAVLAMLGTVADLVELKGVNRQLVKEGLAAAAALPDGPVRAMLLSACESLSAITSTDIAFRVAPRINAAGRMAHPMIALEALLRGGSAITTLATLNDERKDATKAHVEQAVRDCAASSAAFLHTADETLTHGIIGLVAGRLTEQFGKPSMAIAITGDVCTGSLRSTGAYHITEGLEKIKHFFTSFGGHAQAAGCTFDRRHLSAIIDVLSSDIASTVAPELLLPTITIDMPLDCTALSLAFLRSLDALSPFGQSNPEPLFLLQSIRLDAIRRVGDGSHLQARLGPHSCIGFRLGHLADRATGPLDLAVKVAVNRWNNRESVQLMIEDMREAGG